LEGVGVHKVARIVHIYARPSRTEWLFVSLVFRSARKASDRRFRPCRFRISGWPDAARSTRVRSRKL